MRILRKDAWMSLYTEMHYGTLVIHKILYSHRTAYHLSAGTVMVELTILKRQDDNLQSVQFGISQCRILPQSLTEITVQIVISNFTINTSTLTYQKLHGPFTQQPDADVH